MQLQKIVEQLGYSAKEAKVYLAALSLGECHVTDIAAKTKLPRTSVQTIVDKLHEDGLLNFYVQRRYKYWVAENPERILANMKKREEAVREALPELTTMRNATRGKRRAGAKAGHYRELLHTLADALPLPVLITNEDVAIEYVNAPWEEQFGYALAEVRGENPRILQGGETPRTVHERMWKTLRSEKMFQSDEIIDKRKDGTLFNLLTTILPIRCGDELFYIQILDDILGKKRVEQIAKQFSKAIART